MRKGYMGHLILISNHLVKYSELPEIPPNVLEYFQSELWKDYERTILSETNSKDSKPLGGHRPVVASADMFHQGMDETSHDQFDDDFEMDDE